MIDAAPHDDAEQVTVVGQAVHAARKRLGLSVQALAERAGLSLGLVSQLERGLGNPSLQSLQRIAAALGLSTTQLLDGPPTGLSIVRREHREHLAPMPELGEDAQPTRELLTPRSTSTLQVIRTTLPVGFSNETRPFRHIGTEAVTVERGALLVVHGEQRATLAAGDSVTYDCSAPHWWANAADDVTVVLGAVTPYER